MCDVLLSPGVNPTAVKYVYIILYINMELTPELFNFDLDKLQLIVNGVTVM